MLPNLLAFFEENDAELETKNRICSIKQHLQFLRKKLQGIFPDILTYLYYLTHHLHLIEDSRS